MRRTSVYMKPAQAQNRSSVRVAGAAAAARATTRDFRVSLRLYGGRKSGAPMPPCEAVRLELLPTKRNMLEAFEEAYGRVNHRNEGYDPAAGSTSSDNRARRRRRRTPFIISTQQLTQSLKDSNAAAPARRETRSPRSGSPDIERRRPARSRRRTTRAHLTNHTTRPPAFR